jgi:hypothetical protein
MGVRTPDIQLAKLALYQLSYTPDILEAIGLIRIMGLIFIRPAKTELCVTVSTFYWLRLPFVFLDLTTCYYANIAG